MCLETTEILSRSSIRWAPFYCRHPLDEEMVINWRGCPLLYEGFVQSLVPMYIHVGWTVSIGPT